MTFRAKQMVLKQNTSFNSISHSPTCLFQVENTEIVSGLFTNKTRRILRNISPGAEVRLDGEHRINNKLNPVPHMTSKMSRDKVAFEEEECCHHLLIPIPFWRQIFVAGFIKQFEKGDCFHG